MRAVDRRLHLLLGWLSVLTIWQLSSLRVNDAKIAREKLEYLFITEPLKSFCHFRKCLIGCTGHLYSLSGEPHRNIATQGHESLWTILGGIIFFLNLPKYLIRDLGGVESWIPTQMLFLNGSFSYFETTRKQSCSSYLMTNFYIQRLPLTKNKKKINSKESHPRTSNLKC